MQQTLGRVNTLEGQLRQKDEEIDAERRAATERESQNQAMAAEAAEALTRQVVALEAEAAALRKQARDA